MPYTEQTWIDGPGGGTPVSAERLTHIEEGIEGAHVDLAVHEADTTPHGIADPADLVYTGAVDAVNVGLADVVLDVAQINSDIAGLQDVYEAKGTVATHNSALTAHAAAGFLGVKIWNAATSTWDIHPMGFLYLRTAAAPDPTSIMSTYDVQIDGS